MADQDQVDPNDPGDGSLPVFRWKQAGRENLATRNDSLRAGDAPIPLRILGQAADLADARACESLLAPCLAPEPRPRPRMRARPPGPGTTTARPRSCPTMRDTDTPRPARPELLTLQAKTRPRIQWLADQLAELHDWWTESWDGGFLYRRWENIRQARRGGWHGAANWLKASGSVIALCLVLMVIDTGADIVLAVADRLAAAAPTPETSNGFWAVVDNPVRTYITAHTGTGLALSVPAVYVTWQAVGLFGLIGGFFYNTGARLTFVLWGCASVAMVWSATPDDSRIVATGIAVLAWAAASAFALRGLSLRPVVNNFVLPAPAFQPHIEIRPEIHIPAPAPAPDDDAPDNVHPLQR